MLSSNPLPNRPKLIFFYNPMNSSYFLIAVAFRMVVLLLLIILVVRRPRGGGDEDLRSLREERSALQTLLAVEAQKTEQVAARFAESERTLSERTTRTEAMNETKNTVEKLLATATE